MITDKQKLILFFIACEPGLKSIDKLIFVFDQACFPAKIEENLKPLLHNNLIIASGNFYNGTPSMYQVTEEGKRFLMNNFAEEPIIEMIKEMHNPSFLLELFTAILKR